MRSDDERKCSIGRDQLGTYWCGLHGSLKEPCSHWLDVLKFVRSVAGGEPEYLEFPISFICFAKSRKPKLLSDHDVREVVMFQKYLDDLNDSGPNEAFYRRYQKYMGLSNEELAAILAKGEAQGKEPRK